MEKNVKVGLLQEDGVEDEDNKVAEQLAKINEQLVIKNRRARLIWKIVGIILIGFLLFNMLLIVLGYAIFSARTISESGEVSVKEAILEEETVIEQ